jgi:enterochelin esterase family protein
MKLIQTMAGAAVLCAALLAREAPTTTPGTGGGQARAAKIRSPEVLADGRVTFRLLAPKATEVLVQGNWEGGRGLAMTKDDSGLWSVTTAALQPELWAYTFSVDGVRALDPNNYNVARDGGSSSVTGSRAGAGGLTFRGEIPHAGRICPFFR